MGRIGVGRGEGGGEGGRYSCMLEIAYNDEDTKTAPFWKNLCGMPNYICRPSVVCLFTFVLCRMPSDFTSRCH